MDRKRTGRGTTSRAVAAANGRAGSPVSDEDDVEVNLPTTSSRPSTRRRPGVDFSKLDTASLRKYRTHYKLTEVPPNCSKDELIPAVARHFADQVVLDEEETVMSFCMSVKRQQALHTSPPAYKKPRGPAVKGAVKATIR
ncbi:hypothetical protein WJX73_001745 [Symbiochloris irregularis]|uniref:Histone deacetylase complex subunit SAP30 Sin3 binding domain-containing protein n=1 Tax=Symbiochloris irregularis TaxID=706552 RepID=A0AAW1PBT7_9CHLO